MIHQGLPVPPWADQAWRVFTGGGHFGLLNAGHFTPKPPVHGVGEGHSEQLGDTIAAGPRRRIASRFSDVFTFRKSSAGERIKSVLRIMVRATTASFLCFSQLPLSAAGISSNKRSRQSPVATSVASTLPTSAPQQWDRQNSATIYGANTGINVFGLTLGGRDHQTTARSTAGVVCSRSRHLKPRRRESSNSGTIAGRVSRPST